MREIFEKLKKLRGRSFDELRVRGAQSLAASAERAGLSALSRLPSDAALFSKLLDPSRFKVARALSSEVLLEHFRARTTSPRFFAAFDDTDETVAEFCRRFGAAAEEKIIESARRVVAGRFDLLGFRDLSFDDPVDWRLEPTSGRRAPLAHWSLIDYLDPEVAGDKKITWELNRHQHFMLLGRAYLLTRDEIFAETFSAHAASWMDDNPPKLGINWASSLEVSFRAISWLWALYFFKDSPSLTPQLFARMLKFLYLHARHLETYLSTYFSPNTHLTGEALGLFYLGTLLPEFRRAARWRATGRRVMLGELARQVRPDGVYFEQSSYYQRYTADFYTHFLVLARANGEEPGGELEEKLTALLDHLMYLTKPDGTTPLFGDDDGGRLAQLESERAPNDFRAALSNGATLFARPDYKFVAGGSAAEETLWLLGPEGLRKFDALNLCPPAADSRAFDDGGLYVMRDGWARDSNYMLLDCGPHGAPGGAAHAHADALSFELAARGRTLLVDPGTFTYTGSREMRDLFRASAAHNTLTIDGESSSQPEATFKWKHPAARAARREWLTRERFDFFEGEHDGYARLPSSPATHARSVLFLKGDYFVVRDRVETTGAHRYDLNFHFAPGAQPSARDEEGACAVRESWRAKAGLELFTFGSDAGEWRRQAGLFSPCYGASEPAPVYTFSAEEYGPAEFVTFLFPHAPGVLKTSVREVETGGGGGRAFELREDGGAAAACDVLLLGGEGRTVETMRINSSFAWAWLRFASEGAGEPVEIIAVGRGRLSLDGREVLRADEPAKFVVATRRGGGGGEWRVETDAPGGGSVNVAFSNMRPEASVVTVNF